MQSANMLSVMIAHGSESKPTSQQMKRVLCYVYVFEVKIIQKFIWSSLIKMELGCQVR